MLKKNKIKIIISSLIILIPAIFGGVMWNALPNIMTTHWGADGNGDGIMSKAFAVFGLPVILLAFHWVCLLITSFDKKQREQNRKALGMIFWIIPVISLFSNGIMYRAAFGKDFNMAFFMPLLFGVSFIFIGNYLPKIKQNSTLGIKMSWTLKNEENWNRTHRFCGKVWVIGGFVVLLCALLPFAGVIWGVLCVTAVMIVSPMVYSYLVYREHKKAGVVYVRENQSMAEKIAVRITAVVVPLILIGVAVLMFTGNITVDCGDTSLKIDATYWTDLTVDYSEIKAVEYSKDLKVGMRASGFASARLSLGIFENEEFGAYTLYAYTGAEEFVVLTSSDGDTLVIGLGDEKETEAVYKALLEKARIFC